jgi:hypothetical protein
MTAPVKCDEMYYYDGISKRFFSTKPLRDSTDKIELLDMVELAILEPMLTELLKRLADIDSENTEVVEIPRLNVQDKIAIQLLFLSKFPGIIHEEALRLAAEKQRDAFGFVLDGLLTSGDVLAPMEPY